MQALSLGATPDMVGRDAAAITDVPPRPRHRTRQVQKPTYPLVIQATFCGLHLAA